MRKTITSALLFVLALSFASFASAASKSATFESDYPTYVLSDDSAADPQPFEANYPVQITPMRLSAAPDFSQKPVAKPYEINYPTYVLKCSGATPAPFEDCYPVQK